MEADAVRRPAGPEPVLESNRDLVDLVRREITGVGPITFARFMDLALYAPQLGYYVTQATRFGRHGDFLTGPETHPIFGAAIARQIIEVWRRLGEPADFAIREYGAGSGALAEAIVRAVVADAPRLVAGLRYEAVEVNPNRRDELARRLGSAGSGLRFVALDPLSAITEPSQSAGFVLANELFDAFPVHRVEQALDGLRELFVDVRDDHFVEVARPPSTPRLAERLAAEDVHLEMGQRAEIALGLDDWFAGLGWWLRRGVVVIIDYGHASADLYGHRRRAGTLLGYVNHRVVDDPLVAVGRQDLTAHVDFTALERASAGAGFTPLGLTSQAQFLLDLGLEELLERARSDPGQSLGEYLELRSGVARLLDPRHTGGFRVLALGRGIDTSGPLPGLRRPAT
jgi:SAM-dependent MidA family methyltransferase